MRLERKVVIAGGIVFVASACSADPAQVKSNSRESASGSSNATGGSGPAAVSSAESASGSGSTSSASSASGSTGAGGSLDALLSVSSMSVFESETHVAVGSNKFVAVTWIANKADGSRTNGLVFSQDNG